MTLAKPGTDYLKLKPSCSEQQTQNGGHIHTVTILAIQKWKLKINYHNTGKQKCC